MFIENTIQELRLKNINETCYLPEGKIFLMSGNHK